MTAPRAGIALAIGTCVALALSEGGLRLAGRFEPPPPAPVSRRSDLYCPDPELGYTLWPSRTTTYRYPEHSGRDLTLVSNADGFRSGRAILGFYTDDFRRLRPRYAGMGYPSVKFELADGRLTEVPFPGPLPAWQRLRVVQAVDQTYWRFARSRYDLNKALLDRLREVLGPEVTLATVFLPGRADTEEDQHRRGFLPEWSVQAGTPFLDMSDAMHGPEADAL